MCRRFYVTARKMAKMGAKREDFEKKMTERRIRKRYVKGERAYNVGTEELMSCSICFQPVM